MEKALALNADLAVAHTLTELLTELWEQDDEVAAFGCLIEWIEDAEWSQIPEMKAFAKTLRNHWYVDCFSKLDESEEIEEKLSIFYLKQTT